ncbi:MAG: hypothetical protein BWK78_03845 [Thiotrichaceae bacterium IS1]|nr:MAG: hypothetical protein BWK78_03845 [Thiotrichaceae bacterium IS1]
MTSKDQFRVTVLCEDKSHFHLVTGYLKTLGFEARKMTGKIAPLGRGSGEQYVREHFAEFVTAYRQVKHENVILVVITDADKHTYAHRFKTLTDTLTEPLSKEEKIVILIPAKNIETWFCYADNPVECDEKTDYKSQYKNASSSAYGKKYAEDICPNLPTEALSALQEARMEVERVKRLLS